MKFRSHLSRKANTVGLIRLSDNAGEQGSKNSFTSKKTCVSTNTVVFLLFGFSSFYFVCGL